MPALGREHRCDGQGLRRRRAKSRYTTYSPLGIISKTNKKTEEKQITTQAAQENNSAFLS